MVIPFRVQDRDGGAATAQIYVPAKDTGLPSVRSGAVIELEPGESVRARLSDYVVNPRGGQVRFTAAGTAAGSPEGRIDVVATGATSFSVHASRDYQGPGAVTFEVTGQGSENAPDARSVVLSVPVQVGDSRPILRCPTDAVPVAQGDAVDLDIATLCRVFTPDPAAAAGLTFTADWTRSVGGLAIIEPEGRSIVVAAQSGAEAGQ